MPGSIVPMQKLMRRPVRRANREQWTSRCKVLLYKIERRHHSILASAHHNIFLPHLAPLPEVIDRKTICPRNHSMKRRRSSHADVLPVLPTLRGKLNILPRIAQHRPCRLRYAAGNAVHCTCTDPRPVDGTYPAATSCASLS